MDINSFMIVFAPLFIIFEAVMLCLGVRQIKNKKREKAKKEQEEMLTRAMVRANQIIQQNQNK